MFLPKQEKFCNNSYLVELNNFTPLPQLWWFRPSEIPQWDQHYWCQNFQSFILISQHFNVFFWDSKILMFWLIFQDFSLLYWYSNMIMSYIEIPRLNISYWDSKIVIDSIILMLFILRLQDFNVSYGASQEDEIQSREGGLLSGRYGQCKFLLFILWSITDSKWFIRTHFYYHNENQASALESWLKIG